MKNSIVASAIVALSCLSAGSAFAEPEGELRGQFPAGSRQAQQQSSDPASQRAQATAK